MADIEQLWEIVGLLTRPPFQKRSLKMRNFTLSGAFVCNRESVELRRRF
jgi:hypothetical protein